MSTPNQFEAQLRAEDEVVQLCQDLLRIDTTNPGDGTGPGEREAAEYVAVKLAEVGLESEIYESAPGRANVVARISGSDANRPALVVHGHLDVVPADADEWQVDPFAGELIDGVLWGRGAVDMKDMDAMILAVTRQILREGRQPKRDLILAFFADEEAGGVWGSGWSVANRPELFAGASEAISEVGGFSVEVNGTRAYLLQTAEKGMHWLRAVAKGRAGHGSVVNEENAVTRLAGALARIGNHPWPQQLDPVVHDLLTGVAQLTGINPDLTSPQVIEELLTALGPGRGFVQATLQNTANPTRLTAGFKENVIPAEASATIDTRFLPGREEEHLATLRELAGEHVELSTIHQDIALSAPFSGDLVDVMVQAVTDHDPGAVVLPYMLSGGTDNKALARLGIVGYGFAPLQLPNGYDFPAMFHGVDERVPVSALKFGCRVLDQVLMNA